MDFMMQVFDLRHGVETVIYDHLYKLSFELSTPNLADHLLDVSLRVSFCHLRGILITKHFGLLKCLAFLYIHLIRIDILDI